jgi:hypothetical protein
MVKAPDLLQANVSAEVTLDYYKTQDSVGDTKYTPYLLTSLARVQAITEQSTHDHQHSPQASYCAVKLR